MLITQDLAGREAAFAAAILDPARSIPAGIIAPGGGPVGKRFAVYRNNVVSGLIEVLSAAYPAVRRLVGDAFFTAMARLYVGQEPPQSPIMLAYGASFPDFIAAFPPAAELPYLPDVARLEQAWLQAYHAAEATPIDALALQGVAPQRLAEARLTLHPSLRLLRSAFAVVTLWEMNVGNSEPQAVDIVSSENALLLRPAAEVVVRRVSVAVAIFVQALAAGSSLTDATATVLAVAPDVDLAATLQGLLASGAVMGWHLRDMHHSCGGTSSA